MDKRYKTLSRVRKGVYSNNNVEMQFFNIIKTDNCEDKTLI